jgi:hypothetical protein
MEMKEFSGALQTKPTILFSNNYERVVARSVEIYSINMLAPSWLGNSFAHALVPPESQFLVPTRDIGPSPSFDLALGQYMFPALRYLVTVADRRCAQKLCKFLDGHCYRLPGLPGDQGSRFGMNCVDE